MWSARTAGVLDPAGPVAAAERLILFNATGIMLVVVVPVIVMTLAFAWWFRSGNARAVYRPDWSYSGRIELVIWSIPAMIVILLAGVAWIGSHDLDPAAPLPAAGAALKVEVVSLDWKWLFIYPDERIATLNQLIIPVDTPIEFSLTSATVMSAFLVPQLGSQIYTMPGMTTHLNLMASRAGDFAGLSSHFNGNGFSDMHFVVHALARADYARALAAIHRDSAPLTGAVYAELRGAGGNPPAATYGDVDPALFGRILATSAPAGAVPPAR